MKYMVDAQIAHFARKLKVKGIDCETVHMRMKGNEHSEAEIHDDEIVEFLKKAGGTITLITVDKDFVEDCRIANVPCIPVWDAVAEYIMKRIV